MDPVFGHHTNQIHPHRLLYGLVVDPDPDLPLVPHDAYDVATQLTQLLERRGEVQRLAVTGQQGVDDDDRQILEKGIVKLSRIGLTAPQHVRFTTGSSPSSWGSVSRVFVNLTMPSRRSPGLLPRATWKHGSAAPCPQGGSDRRHSISHPRGWRVPLYVAGRRMLFTLSSAPGPDDNQIALLDVSTGEHEVIIANGTDARYVPTGHIVYGVGGALLGVAFDLESWTIVGDPVSIVDDVATKASGVVSYDVSETGSLVYMRETDTRYQPLQTLVWVDRNGREEAIDLPPAPYGWVRVSPDGTRLVFADWGERGLSDVWMADLTRPGIRNKVTTDPARDTRPLWTPDGERVVFESWRTGRPELFQKAADGTGQAESILTLEGAIFFYPYQWTPDGRSLIVNYRTPEMGTDNGVLSFDGEPNWHPLVPTPAGEGNPTISPNGAWIAYRSDETGEDVLYVARFPTLEDRQPFTSGGAWAPMFSLDGKELFYRSAEGLMSIPITSEEPFTMGTPEIVLPESMFEGTYRYFPGGPRLYDPAPDGQRFLMKKLAPTNDYPQVVLVQNWFQELTERVPVP